MATTRLYAVLSASEISRINFSNLQQTKDTVRYTTDGKFFIVKYDSDLPIYPLQYTTPVITGESLTKILTTVDTQTWEVFDLDRDSDAKEYIEKIKPIDSTNQRRIFRFIIGAKELGLWDNMVCWPLIINQNSNSSSVYSIGGLGSFSGALLNNPVWTSSGLFSNDRNKAVITSRQLLGYNQRTFYSVAQLSGYDFFTNRRQLMYAAFAEPEFVEFNIKCNGMSLAAPWAGNNIGPQIANADESITGPSRGLSALKTFINFSSIAEAQLWRSYSTVLSSRRLTLYLNGISANSNLGNIWADSITDGAPLYLMNAQEVGSNDAGMRGTMAFAADFNIALSNIQLSSFDILYKTTLGEDLGLT